LTAEEKAGIRYGIRHKDKDRETLVENTFSRIIDMTGLNDMTVIKFKDISTLAITEVVGWR